MSFTDGIKHGFENADKFSPQTRLRAMEAIRPTILAGVVLSIAALAYIASVSWICFTLACFMIVVWMFAGIRAGVIRTNDAVVAWAAKASAQYIINNCLADPSDEGFTDEQRESMYRDFEDVLTERIPPCVAAVVCRVECDVEKNPDGTGGKYGLTLHPGNWIAVWVVDDDASAPLSSGYVDMDARRIHTLHDVNPKALSLLTAKLFVELDAKKEQVS